LTTDDFLKQANQLYGAAIADLNDEDYVINEKQQFAFLEALCFFVKTAYSCGGEIEVSPITPKQGNGGITATYQVFDVTGEDIPRMCNALKHTSAITIDGMTDGKICISVTVPNVYCRKQSNI